MKDTPGKNGFLIGQMAKLVDASHSKCDDICFKGSIPFLPKRKVFLVKKNFLISKLDIFDSSWI